MPVRRRSASRTVRSEQPTAAIEHDGFGGRFIPGRRPAQDLVDRQDLRHRHPAGARQVGRGGGHHLMPAGGRLEEGARPTHRTRLTQHLLFGRQQHRIGRQHGIDEFAGLVAPADQPTPGRGDGQVGRLLGEDRSEFGD
jgi:hypothetical protein